MAFKVIKECVMCFVPFMAHPKQLKKTCSEQCSKAYNAFKNSNEYVRDYQSKYNKRPDVIARRKKHRDDPIRKEETRLKRSTPEMMAKNRIHQEAYRKDPVHFEAIVSYQAKYYKRKYEEKFDNAINTLKQQLNNSEYIKFVLSR